MANTSWPQATKDGPNKSSARSYRWVWIWLGLGVVFAVLLLANSLRDYFFVARVLNIQQVRHQVAQHVTAYERELAENSSPDEPHLPLLTAEMSTASKKPLWIVLRDPDGKVVEQSGAPEREVFTHDEETSHFRSRQPLFSVIRTNQGEAVVEVFPVFIRPRRPPGEQPPPPEPGRRGPYVIATEIAMPLSAADPAALWPIRRNLAINTAAAFALLLTVALTAIGFRSYARGEHLEHQLEIAREVQANLLPKNLQEEGVQVAAEYQPADEVSGDFYDVFHAGKGTAFVIGDVSGKGVPAALLVGVIHGAVRSSKWPESQGSQERETAALNRLLCERASDEQFATMFWCYSDAENGALHYVNAGHCPPMLVGLRGGKTEVRRLDKGGPALGVLSGAVYAQGHAGIQAGDLLVLYSDGLIEATNAAGEEFGESRVAEVIGRTVRESPEKIRDSILAAVRGFLKDKPAQDDLTCVVARFGAENSMAVPDRAREESWAVTPAQHPA